MIPRPSRQALHAQLLHAASATMVLERLLGCDLRARPRPAGEAGQIAPDPALQAMAQGTLAPRPGEPLAHRAISLMAGEAVLSDADLIYIPTRLPAAMAAALRDSDVPFGRVIAPLCPERLVLFARLGEAGEAAALIHHALIRAGGQPIALAMERYRWEALSLP